MTLSVRLRYSLITQQVKKFFIRNHPKNYATEGGMPREGSGNQLWKSVVKSAGVGLLCGTAYAWYILQYKTPDSFAAIEARLENAKILKSIPNVEFARQIQIPSDKTNLEIILFQYPTCPFCCKVRAFLDYYGISYNVVEVDPVLRQQIKWSDYKKVPILLVKSGNEYMQFNDSTMIISSLATFLRSGNKITLKQIQDYYPSVSDSANDRNKNILNKYFVMHGKTDEAILKKDKEEREWRKWADEVLVHTLSPNVYRTKEEALEAFKWFSEIGEWERLFPTWERNLIIYVGAYAMYFVGKKLKKKHHLKGNVRLSLYEECSEWVKEVDKRGKFFGGVSPNLSDLAVYGVLSSIEGCLAFKELLENTKIGPWYSSMKAVVQNHRGLDTLG